MDYAAALRASPAGPVMRIDTTPVAKAQPQKVAIAKPAKVEVEEPAHVVEDETLPSIAAPSAPAKPPTNAGLSPVVRFMINVPHSASTAKDAPSASAETIADNSDSGSDTEEDGSGDAAANGSKTNKNEPKAHYYSAHDLEVNKARLMDLVALLENNAEDSAFELSGGFRFSKSVKGSGKAPGANYHDLEFPTVTLSLKWLSALIELLRSKQSTTTALGGGSFVSFARVEGQIRVIRISNASVAGKEVWLQFDDVVLEVREQAKLYLSVANRIEQVLERKEAQMGEASRKDAAKKRKAISNKLHTPAFTSMLATLHHLLGTVTEFPSLTKRFHDQEAQLAQERRRVKDENQDMMAMFLAMVPSNLLEANLKHISAKFEPAEPETEEATSSASPADTKEEKPKKLSKKEQALADKAAAAAELERKMKAEADAEAARKEADKVRREKAEKVAALAAEQKKKQLVANPFAHLEGFSESAAAQLESEAEVAKEKKIKKDAEAKVKAESKAAEDAKALAAQQAAERAARSAKTSAAAQESLKRQATDDSKRSANKEAEDKRRAAAKEAEAKKREAAERQAAEQAAAAKRKQEKADKVAAEKAAAAERKKTSQPSPVAAAPQEDKKKGSAGPDRSEKQRKAEKIEHQQKEKQRAKEIRQIAAQKKTDNTMLYGAIGGGAFVVLLLAFFIYNQMASGAVSI